MRFIETLRACARCGAATFIIAYRDMPYLTAWDTMPVDRNSEAFRRAFARLDACWPARAAATGAPPSSADQ